ncbi:MAG: YceI family protein [Chitinophagaceae bacterium]
METTLTKTKWNIDKTHSEIGFKVKHLMITNVRGTFGEFDASIYTTEEDFVSAEIDVWIDPSSVNTGSEQRDKHLRGADFFDVEQFKEIHFTGNTFTKTGEDEYELYGELTIKGIKKQIKLMVESGAVVKDPWGGYRTGFTITGKINRKDWGLNWNTALEAGGLMVSDEVKINCEVQLTKDAEPAS